MAKRIFRSSLLAMLLAASAGADNMAPIGVPEFGYYGNEENFGTYRASSRTHKRYLRKHHLGKFRKGRK